MSGMGIPISIHAAREGGDRDDRFRTHKQPISIHAAREGGDLMTKKFNYGKGISIHAAREGGDVAVRMESIRLRYFNPRRP